MALVAVSTSQRYGRETESNTNKTSFSPFNGCLLQKKKKIIHSGMEHLRTIRFIAA